MSIIRTSTRAIRVLAYRSKSGRRAYTQVSQPLLKVSRAEASSQPHRKSDGWLFPVAIAVLGLGFSTFSTHQLISGNDRVKAFSTNRK